MSISKILKKISIYIKLKIDICDLLIKKGKK